MLLRLTDSGVSINYMIGEFQMQVNFHILLESVGLNLYMYK